MLVLVLLLWLGCEVAELSNLATFAALSASSGSEVGGRLTGNVKGLASLTARASSGVSGLRDWP